MKEQRENTLKDKSSDSTIAQKVNLYLDFWAPILTTVLLYIGVRHYVAEARYIPSGSMLPSLQINDRLLVEKLTFRWRSPRRGEIVVFNSPYSFDDFLRPKSSPTSFQCALVNLPPFAFLPGLANPSCNAYIKRVVAIPGDNVFVDLKGRVFVNQVLTDEPYVTEYCGVSNECRTINRLVPDGHVFVLGDNRKNSWDGRFWPASPFLPENEILGRAVWRFWPINRVGLLLQ